MPVRIFLIAAFLGLWLFQGCNSPSMEKANLHGTFTNLTNTKLYLYQILPFTRPLIDSVSTDGSGNFSFTFKVKQAGCYSLRQNAENEITLVIAPGEDITIKGEGNSLKTYTVEGSPDSKLFAEYNRFTAANLSRVDSLSRIFAESRSNPDFATVKSSLDSAYLKVFSDQKEKVLLFVGRHPGSLASLLVASNGFGPNPVLSEQTHPALFIRLDSALFQKYPENSLVNAFHMRMLALKADLADRKAHDKFLNPGMPVPEITLPNARGKATKLSSQKGKLTLVYFWSSWDARCRQTNMNLTGIYNQYHDRGFEIYAVSIDSETGLWEKAFMLDKAYWVQVIDTAGLKSEYTKAFAVCSIPKMILVGKDGNIITATLVPDDLNNLIKKNL